ncbi:MAG TPA: nucleotidyltransferase family protein [Gemmataceae bacterium]|jgi:hypothetical protein|nr:nucleotidyltransferase family protein [Gemmataceae bacterium]
MVAVSRSRALEILKEERPYLREKFGVRTLGIFGSVARDEATTKSDVDLLVDFDRPVSLFHVGGLVSYLEEKLGVEKVDVVDPDRIYPFLRKRILKEAIYVE